MILVESELQPFLNRAALDLQALGRSAILGDQMFLRRVEVFTKSEARAATQRAETAAVRTGAESAWERKDWGVVVRLYTALAPGLTSVEQARLEYAQRRAAERDDAI